MSSVYLAASPNPPSAPPGPERGYIVSHVVLASGGTVSGRHRLQKYVYLLDSAGMGSGFDFDYPGFGPFSNSLDRAIDDAVSDGLITERVIHPEHHGERYSVLIGTQKSDAFISGLTTDTTQRMLSILTQENMMIISLAAAVDWLWRHEHSENWFRDILRRRPVRSNGGRLSLATDLLDRIGLPAPNVAKEVCG